MASKRYRDSESPDESDVEVKNFRTEVGLFSGLSIYFIQAKIEPSELDLLYSIAEASGANIRTNIEEADIVVTAITMRKRLERHIEWDIAVTFESHFEEY
jgi:DNA polymerase mu